MSAHESVIRRDEYSGILFAASPRQGAGHRAETEHGPAPLLGNNHRVALDCRISNAACFHFTIARLTGDAPLVAGRVSVRIKY